MNIKKGDWIGAIDARSRGSRPFSRGVQVVSVGKEVRVGITFLGKPTYMRLQPKDVLRVFASQEEADTHMQVAAERWKEGNEKIKQATDQRDAAVLSAIQSGASQ